MFWRVVFLTTVVALAGYAGYNYAKSQAACKCDPCHCTPDKSCHKVTGAEVKRVEDARCQYVTLFYKTGWQTDQKCVTIYNALKADPRVTKTHFNVYTPDNLLYKERWSGSVKTFPALVLQDASGRQISGSPYAGKRFPDNKQELNGCLFWWKKVTPTPNPQPKPNPDQEEVDEDEEEVDEEPAGLPFWLIALLSVGGVAAGAAWKWREDSK